ncbi:MAG: hypothetical protein WC819_05305 [Parcubacteria group bacterium]|jgi:hypothetical protein
MITSLIALICLALFFGRFVVKANEIHAEKKGQKITRTNTIISSVIGAGLGTVIGFIIIGFLIRIFSTTQLVEDYKMSIAPISENSYVSEVRIDNNCYYAFHQQDLDKNDRRKVAFTMLSCRKVKILQDKNREDAYIAFEVEKNTVQQPLMHYFLPKMLYENLQPNFTGKYIIHIPEGTLTPPYPIPR